MKVRLYPQTEPGDSLIQRGSMPGGSITRAWTKVASSAEFVRSNMMSVNPPPPHYDALAIEAEARAARSAWIGIKLKSCYQVLARRFTRSDQVPAEKCTG